MATLFVHADFVRPSFHGLGARGEPEWPPSPLRLAQALMAAWGALGQPAELRRALDALVRLPQPVIHAPEAVSTRLPTRYTGHSGVVTSTSPTQLAKVFDLSHVGLSRRNNVAKPAGVTHLAGTRLVFELSDPLGTVDPECLDVLARAVLYLGRSQDLCDLWVSTSRGDPLPVRWAPVPHRAGRSRGWTEHSPRWMDMGFRIMEQGLDVPRPDPAFFTVPLDYTQEAWTPSAVLPDTDGRDVAVRVFTLDSPLASSRVPEVMGRLAQVGLTCFPCVFSGHPRATGALHGVGVLLPPDLPEEPGLTDLVLGTLPRLRLDAGRSMTRHTTDPRRWTGASTTWVSATPLRAFPDERVVTHQLTRWAEDVAGSPLRELQLSRVPVEPWHHRWRQLPDGLDTWWVRMEFADRVHGPVMAGAATDLGFGLMIPQERSA